jgi:hypothetical protein
MAPVEAALKSPSIPLFSKGEVSLTLFGKERKGRFLGGMRGNYVANFWGRTLDQEDKRKSAKFKLTGI